MPFPEGQFEQVFFGHHGFEDRLPGPYVDFVGKSLVKDIDHLAFEAIWLGIRKCLFADEDFLGPDGHVLLPVAG